jgi:hypothetical protein
LREWEWHCYNFFELKWLKNSGLLSLNITDGKRWKSVVDKTHTSVSNSVRRQKYGNYAWLLSAQKVGG